MRCACINPRATTATVGIRRIATAKRGVTVGRASGSGTPEGNRRERQATSATGNTEMDPNQRKTDEVPAVEVIESDEGEPGSSSMGTILGAAGGMAAAGGLAAVAALGAPVAVAAAAVGGVVGAFAGGAMGKEVPRGVDINSAMEFDQPEVKAAGQEQERQNLADKVGLGSGQRAAGGAGQLGENEIADVQKK